MKWTREAKMMLPDLYFIFFINVPFSVHDHLIGWILNISFGKNVYFFFVIGLHHFWLKSFNMIAFHFLLTSVVCALVYWLCHSIWIKMSNVSIIRWVKSKIKTLYTWKTVVALQMERTTVIERVKISFRDFAMFD